MQRNNHKLSGAGSLGRESSPTVMESTVHVPREEVSVPSILWSIMCYEFSWSMARHQRALSATDHSVHDSLLPRSALPDLVAHVNQTPCAGNEPDALGVWHYMSRAPLQMHGRRRGHMCI